MSFRLFDMSYIPKIAFFAICNGAKTPTPTPLRDQTQQGLIAGNK